MIVGRPHKKNCRPTVRRISMHLTDDAIEKPLRNIKFIKIKENSRKRSHTE